MVIVGKLWNIFTVTHENKISSETSYYCTTNPNNTHRWIRTGITELQIYSLFLLEHYSELYFPLDV